MQINLFQITLEQLQFIKMRYYKLTRNLICQSIVRVIGLGILFGWEWSALRRVKEPYTYLFIWRHCFAQSSNMSQLYLNNWASISFLKSACSWLIQELVTFTKRLSFFFQDFSLCSWIPEINKHPLKIPTVINASNAIPTRFSLRI